MDVEAVDAVEYSDYEEQSDSTAIESAQVAIEMAGILPGSLHNRMVGGDYPIFLALRGGEYAFVKGLLDEGSADPNQVGLKGDTPLTLAIQQRDREAVRILLEAGGDLDRMNGKGVTPRQLAEQLGFELDQLAPSPFEAEGIPFATAGVQLLGVEILHTEQQR